MKHIKETGVIVQLCLAEDIIRRTHWGYRLDTFGGLEKAIPARVRTLDSKRVIKVVSRSREDNGQTPMTDYK